MATEECDRPEGGRPLQGPVCLRTVLMLRMLPGRPFRTSARLEFGWSSAGSIRILSESAAVVAEKTNHGVVAANGHQPGRDHGSGRLLAAGCGDLGARDGLACG